MRVDWQRAALERGYLILSQAHLRPAAVNRIFRLPLLYSTRDQLLQKFHALLNNSKMKPLEMFNLPFVHLGGAGTHYNKGARVRNGFYIKQGPLQQQARLESADRADLGWNIDIDMKEYEGVWFDAQDVEGYLTEKGIRIGPQSSFAEARVDVDMIPRTVYEMSGVEPPSPTSPMTFPPVDTVSATTPTAAQPPPATQI